MLQVLVTLKVALILENLGSRKLEKLLDPFLPAGLRKELDFFFLPCVGLITIRVLPFEP